MTVACPLSMGTLLLAGLEFVLPWRGGGSGA